MAGGKMNIDEFVKDYHAGVPDKVLSSKHGLTAAQMIEFVKGLVKKGTLSKKDYQNRRKKMEDLAMREEQDFLKSLYHCSVCSHLQPTPFVRCPACGTQTSEQKNLERASERGQPTRGSTTTGAPGGELRAGEARSAVADDRDRRAVPEASVAQEIPEELQRKVGAQLTNLELLPECAEKFTGLEFRISGLIGTGVKAAVFKAENPTNAGPPLRTKLFYPEQTQRVDLTEVIEKIVAYQSNMDDPNILRIIGTATLDESPVILYEHLPVNAEALLMQEPDGLPVDLVIGMLPQILNGLGYAHMHRGKDGVIRKLANVSLKPSKLLLDEGMGVVKIDDCGVCKALMEGKGYDPHPWDTLGVDPAGRAPETFVLDSKFVNLTLMDIYALGALLYRLVTGQPPFSCASMDEYRFAHLRKYPVPPRVHRYDIPLWLDEMILKCMEKEPADRWRSPTQMELALGTEAGKRTV
jgi:hypothetical protein